MPRFDGTGPRGAGPMTGRGEGYCVLEMSESGEPIRGYVGREGVPVGASAGEAASGDDPARWAPAGAVRGRIWAGRRWPRQGRGHRLRRW